LYFRVKGSFDAFKKIVAESGIKGLYRGVVPNVQRAALVNMGGNPSISGRHIAVMSDLTGKISFDLQPIN
jgi:hypothetical protein